MRDLYLVIFSERNLEGCNTLGTKNFCQDPADGTKLHLNSDLLTFTSACVLSCTAACTKTDSVRAMIMYRAIFCMCADMATVTLPPSQCSTPFVNRRIPFKWQHVLFGDTPKLSPRRNRLPVVRTRPPLPSLAQLLIGPAFFGATTAHGGYSACLGKVNRTIS